MNQEGRGVRRRMRLRVDDPRTGFMGRFQLPRSKVTTVPAKAVPTHSRQEYVLCQGQYIAHGTLLHWRGSVLQVSYSKFYIYSMYIHSQADVTRHCGIFQVCTLQDACRRPGFIPVSAVLVQLLVNLFLRLPLVRMLQSLINPSHSNLAPDCDAASKCTAPCSAATNSRTNCRVWGLEIIIIVTINIH